ncbi:S-methyl thiohydantoin desulfurase domain-containing protein [Arthrobacter pigmenti]
MLSVFDGLMAAEHCPITKICLTEIGGMNALAPLPLAGAMPLVDADLMGRALPDLDQFSLLVDDLPGLAIAISAWTHGSLLLADARPADVEHVLRAAFQSAGGWAGIVIGGFTVGDLVDHAMPGTLARALELGVAWGEGPSPIEPRIRAIGARRLGVGRVTAVSHDPADVRVRVIDLADDGGALVRVIARSEALACMVDGAVVARAPQIIDVVDPQSGAILQADEITSGRSIAVLSIDAPGWWSARAERLAKVLPSHYGLAGLDGTHP